MQPRELRTHHHEARAGNAARRFEIQSAERFAQLDVIPRLEVELARLAPAAHFDVGLLIAPFRHRLVQQVRQAHLPLIELRLHFGELLVRRPPVAA